MEEKKTLTLEEVKLKAKNAIYTDDNIASLTEEIAEDLKEALDVDDIMVFKHFSKRKGKWSVVYLRRMNSIKEVDMYTFESQTSPVSANKNLIKNLVVAGNEELLTEKMFVSSGLFMFASKIISDFTSEMDVF
mgnify:CR=1 FL=1